MRLSLPDSQPGLSTQLQPFQRDRREFFKVMGVVGVASAIALTKSFQSLVQASSVEAKQPYDRCSCPNPGGAVGSGYTASQCRQRGCLVAVATTEPTATTQVTATAVPTATATAIAPQQSVASAQTTSCFVRCNQGCSAPGRCRRFSDTNGTGICDQTECA